MSEIGFSKFGRLLCQNHLAIHDNEFGRILFEFVLGLLSNLIRRLKYDFSEIPRASRACLLPINRLISFSKMCA
jgi:hypothetical protein